MPSSEHSCIVASALSGQSSFKCLDDATCEFSATVLGRYDGLVALAAGGLRFYVHGPVADRLEAGTHIQGRGTLLLDHYAWFEGVGAFKDPPDLFYDAKVVRIRSVQIPERFVHRHDKGKVLPTRVESGNYSPKHVKELTTMKGQEFDEEFYLVDLDVRAIESAG